MSAIYDSLTGSVPVLFLTFDRAIDIAGLDGSAIIVHDWPLTGENWDASAGAIQPEPRTVRLTLLDLGDATGEELVLDAGAGNGIVAADDGAVWDGCVGLVLPFP